MIDLHLHTTASDGCLSPEALINKAFAAGIRTLAVTDHDTMAAVPATASLAASYGMTAVPGIEMTAVADGRDVHVLGYFVPANSPELATVISQQRQERVDRAREIVDRLEAAGAPVDCALLFDSTGSPNGRSIARPQIARALMSAGHVSSIAEAFERFLGEGGPAYVPHRGLRPERIVEVITRAGGIASLAHPGPLKRDDLFPSLIDAGLAAVEAYHSDHDAETQQRYVKVARDCNLAVTGGSDFHGNGRPRDAYFGVTSLPAEEFARLLERVVSVSV